MGGQHPGMGGQHPNMGGQHPNMGGQHPVMGGQHPAMGGQHPTLPPHYRHHMAKEQEHEGMSAFKKLVAQMGGQESREQPVLAESLSNTPLNTEVLALPEAEQVIRGLNSGNITVEQLVQQLANPALAQRQRDLILSVLKLRSLGARGQGLPPPMPQQMARVSPVPQQADPMMLLPQGVPGPAARVSPLMFPPGAPPPHLSVSPAPQAARVPSPQEMTMLTQHIMQQALIKRKP